MQRILIPGRKKIEKSACLEYIKLNYCHFTHFEFILKYLLKNKKQQFTGNNNNNKTLPRWNIQFNINNLLSNIANFLKLRILQILENKKFNLLQNDLRKCKKFISYHPIILYYFSMYIESLKTANVEMTMQDLLLKT